jgi:hypothetical protein
MISAQSNPSVRGGAKVASDEPDRMGGVAVDAFVGKRTFPGF